MKKMIICGFYIAIIILSILYFKIPLGISFAHPGNALIVLSPLLMGTRYGMVASFMGALLFDLLAGYLTSAPRILFENAVVVLVVGFLYQYFIKGKETFLKIAFLGIVGATLKVCLTFLSNGVEALVLLGDFRVGVAKAISKLPATLSAATVTIVLVPILFFSLKKVFLKYFHEDK